MLDYHRLGNEISPPAFQISELFGKRDISWHVSAVITHLHAESRYEVQCMLCVPQQHVYLRVRPRENQAETGRR